MKCVKTSWTYSSTIIRNISKSTTARLVLMLELVQLLGLLGIVNLVIVQLEIVQLLGLVSSVPCLDPSKAGEL